MCEWLTLSDDDINRDLFFNYFIPLNKGFLLYTD